MIKYILTAFIGMLPLFLFSNMLENGNFERVTPRKMPENWEITNKSIAMGESMVRMEITRVSDSPAGPNCLRIVNPQTYINDVYGSLVQFPKLVSGRKYRLGFYMKGEPISMMLIIRGNNWGQRWKVPAGALKSDTWKYFFNEFEAQPKLFDKDGGYMVRFNIEGYTKGFLLDGITLLPVDGETFPLKKNASFHVNTLKQLPGTEDSGFFLADLSFHGRELPADWTLEVEFKGTDGIVHTQKVEKLRPVSKNEEFRLNLALPLDIPIGKFDVSLKVAGQELEFASSTFEKKESPLKQEIADLKERLAKIQQCYQTLSTKKIEKKSAYLELYRTILPDQIELLEKELCREFKNVSDQNYCVTRSRIAVPELEEALDDFNVLLDQPKNFPLTWKYISSPVKYVDGFPMARMRREDGVTMERRVLFGGFGHFTQAQQALPFFNRIGGNYIQMEIGPGWVFSSPGKKTEFEPGNYDQFEKYVYPVLKRAWENNQQVSFLLSPHHVPNWFLKRYPEARNGGTFMPYDLRHPKVQEMFDAYITYIATKLKQSPYRLAVHDIVLSNEPTYENFSVGNSKFARSVFEKFILDNYGSLDEFNRIAGTDFPDFDKLLNAVNSNPAAKREFIRCRNNEFAGWHAAMAEKIRKIWPEAPPINVKIMIFAALHDNQVNSGVEPELFSEFCDLNGNDNYGADLWLNNTMLTDLQFSLKPVSILNTENHFIHDEEELRVPSDRIYTALFQEYMHGASGLVGWVWANVSYKGPSYLKGGIRLRAKNLLAHQKAILDVNRLAEEIVAFNLVKPKIAILYSPESMMLNRNIASRETVRLYCDLATTGHKVGFLSEKQIQRGEFGEIKILFVPASRNIARKTLKALHGFNGMIVGRGECFTQDEYGKPLNAELKLFRAESRQALKRFVKRLPLPADVDVRTREKAKFVVQRRIVTLPDGRILANIVNYDVTPHQIKLTPPVGKKTVDLISGKEYPTEFTMQPNDVMLLEFQ